MLFIALDSVWLLMVAQKFYKEHLGFLFSDQFKLDVAAVFYFVYSFCVSYLVIFPALLRGAGSFSVLLGGFILGIAAYSAYNLTNYATIKDWPPIVTYIDLSWGGFVTAFSSFVAYKVLLFTGYAR